MDFTEIEKKMIVGGLETEWGHLADTIDKITWMWESGIRFEGEVLESAIEMFSDYQYFLGIEKKIFESLDDGEEKQNLLRDVNRTMSQFNKCKEIVGFFEDEEQPETDDGNGVLGDKA